ncbi:protein kinase [Penicillium malachiteum]|uniref:non-specific serine/threonine protein kinase n=1 Tax=Penicillium malachiteum TaxID=1324776 RepID=A0AAD6HPR9_9EURO|nr:protein kinase [Penicillium malachiteum]
MIALRMRPTASLPPSFCIPQIRWIRAPLALDRPTHTIAHSQAIEEQSLPFYDRKRYYPVEIGQVFHNQYQIIVKLGYGAYSNVWLVRDESVDGYVSLKISLQTDRSHDGNSPVLNEVNMLRRLEQFANEDHPGLDFTRLARDIFEIESLGGFHYCIAFQPQGNSVRTLQETFPNAKIPKFLVKCLIHRLFFSVNWLHATCGVAHTVQQAQ